ncbi:MAG: hypothetical protein HY421_03110 [Candidatus Kerfeldbacteria bacterium]|nr:hypothetical protein [Candidatus Kerfeldbacteria bacterium]
MSLTNEDLKKIQELLEPRFFGVEADLRQLTKVEMPALHRKIDKLTNTVDGFLGIIRRHDQEWLIVRTQHEKMRNVLVKKGIASEDELSVTR